MSILLSNEIMTSVIRELKNATKSVQIITAYCKEGAIQKLDSYISKDISEKKIMLRFRLDDLVKGSTDFSALEYCFNNGWKVFIRFDLHAKTYIVDSKRGFVGSANATNSGLNIGRTGNMEMATLVDIEEEDLAKIENLYNDAIPVTPELLSKMKKEFESVESEVTDKTVKWGEDISTLFSPHIQTLFSHDLPDENELLIGKYISFLDCYYDGDIEKLKESFRWSNAYLWLINVLKENDGCLYFGAITAKLHVALISDPKPYRKDVKQMLANLLTLIDTLQMEEVVIDQPNYSQRIRLVK